jgi:serine/threonine protein phosphatase PrpC
LGLERAARRFVALANERGGKDNITALVVQVESYGRLPTNPGPGQVLPTARPGKEGP